MVMFMPRVRTLDLGKTTIDHFHLSKSRKVLYTAKIGIGTSV